jgi:multidrug efflux system membrane fusion protein
VRLTVNTIKNAVTVPVTALRHGANGDFVYVLNPQTRTVAQTSVTRGQGTVDRIEVKTGLQGGETVITEGADRLKDGAKVMLPGDRPAGGQGGQGGQGGWQGHRGGQGGAQQQQQQQGQDGQPAPGQHRRRQQQGAAQ